MGGGNQNIRIRMGGGGDYTGCVISSILKMMNIQESTMTQNCFFFDMKNTPRGRRGKGEGGYRDIDNLLKLFSPTVVETLNLGSHFIYITANQDVHALTQKKSSSILPITPFKL